MKKLYTLFLALIFAGSLMAQAPQSFKYQAVARNAGGNVVAGQAVGMQISILQGSISGIALYVETFTPSTNGFGLINLNIGEGTVVSGNFASIDWSAGTYFVKIEMDITGGTTYEEYGTSQLLSVPYALHAKTAANTFSGNYNDLKDAPIYVSTFKNDAGYLTFFTETDPVFTAWDKNTGISITESQITDLDHFANTDETDPVFGAHAANVISSTNITNWSTAYGWGDHSILGYFAAGGEAGGTNRTFGNTDDYSLGFKTNDATRLFISNDGNVGIGTTTTTDKLNVDGSLRLGVVNYVRVDGNTGFLGLSGGDGWISTGAIIQLFGASASAEYANSIRFLNNGGEAMRIAGPSGNVGIGTTSPSTELDVNGVVTASGGNSNDWNNKSEFSGNYDDLTNKPEITTTPNILIGQGAGENTPSDRDIVAIGNSALYNNGIGATQSYHAANNIALGSQALYSNTTGFRNTANGNYALYSNTTGNNNTANGFQALYANTTSYGNTANGNYALYFNTTGNNNTANGNYALYANTTGNRNTANGYSAIRYNTTGYRNTANGYRALYANTTGNYNTANGYYTLYANTTGNNNTANGNSALRYNTTGYSNVATGVGALYRNTTKSNLVAIGDSALFNNGIGTTQSWHAKYNIAVGSKALYSNTTGYENTANGIYALHFNTTGDGNTANGYFALYHNTTGIHNTAIGNGALSSNTTGSYNTAIGNGALSWNYIGNSNTAFGWNAGPDIGLQQLSNTGAFGDWAKVTASNTIRIGNSNIISIGGYTGWSNLSDGRFKTNVSLNVPGIEFIMKLNPVTFNWDLNSLDEFNGTPDSLYTQNPEMRQARLEKEARVYTGFIAQEVEKAANACGFDFSAIIKPSNEKSHYNLSYAGFVVPLVKAMQEQQALLEEQQDLIQTLQVEIAQIKALIEKQ